MAQSPFLFRYQVSTISRHLLRIVGVSSVANFDIAQVLLRSPESVASLAATRRHTRLNTTHQRIRLLPHILHLAARSDMGGTSHALIFDPSINARMTPLLCA